MISTHYHVHELLHEWAAGSGHAEHGTNHASTEHAADIDETFSLLPTLGADEILTAGIFVSLGLFVFTALQLSHLRKSFSSQKAAEERAHNLALHDSLTGLANRRHFELVAKPLIEQVSLKPRALVTIDLDNFKPVNDLYGHAAGDQLLVESAARLKDIPNIAQIARFGGDEFAILTEPLGQAEDAIHIGNLIIAELQKPFTIKNDVVQIGASIGIAMISPDTPTVEEAMRHADIALYRAKNAGKNAVSCFDKSMDEALKKRSHMQRELKLALENDHIMPYFQKVVDLETLEIVGYEALARWVHPTMGVIHPADFIPLAEESNLIEELGYMILRKSAAIACEWPNTIKLAINLSPVQLRDPSCALKIIQTIADAGLMPQRLEVEITENALIGDLQRAKEVLGQLRDVGISIVMDDFGTGQSTLGHLRACQFDKIKIDRSFIAKMQNERESEIIVDAILGLSKGFGLVTTAEGIEDVALISQLLGKGCAQGQGFYFGQPLPQNVAENSAERKFG